MSAWKRTAADKVAARDALIPVEWKIPTTDSLNVIDFPRTCGLLSQSELEITETDAVSLVEKMINRSLTSRKVTEAFCKRAAIAQQLASHFIPSNHPTSFALLLLPRLSSDVGADML